MNIQAALQPIYGDGEQNITEDLYKSYNTDYRVGLADQGQSFGFLRRGDKYIFHVVTNISTTGTSGWVNPVFQTSWNAPSSDFTQKQQYVESTIVPYYKKLLASGDGKEMLSANDSSNFADIVQAATQSFRDTSKSALQRKDEFDAAMRRIRGSQRLNQQVQNTQNNIQQALSAPSSNVPGPSLGLRTRRGSIVSTPTPAATPAKTWYQSMTGTGKRTKSRRGRKAKQTHRKKLSKRRR
jgi:hypothetical protein